MANEFTYRADHIGGLIAPAALSDVRERYARGEIDLDRLREAETIAVKSAADMQRSVGLSVTTDGGFRRADHAALKLDGSTLAKSEAAPLRLLSRRPIKVAVPAARPAAGAPFDRALARAAIVKGEIEALVAAGVDYIQLDATGYGVLFDDGGGVGRQPSGGTPDRTFDALLQLDAAALAGIDRPANVRIAVHFVRPHNAVARQSVSRHGDPERLLQALPVDRFILPMDGVSQEFDLLRLVPKGKLAVLGLVSATKAALENIDDLMAWIDQAAKRMDGDDLALSPAAGFVAGSGLSESDQRRKLELVAEAATRWWGFAM
jgi:5-methyltetrahydropteroyltriglutamate--homocysteine methyltransferase